jgi:hypothetical protein
MELKLSKTEIEAMIKSLQITTAQYDFRTGTKEKFFEYLEARKLLDRLQDIYRVSFTDWVSQ